jgi:hypothetical protein
LPASARRGEHGLGGAGNGIDGDWEEVREFMAALQR